jgi:hypothetical protein
MLYQPDLMIYLLMLPVMGFIIVPVLWTMTCMLYRAMERSRLANVSGFVDFGTTKSAEVKNKRKQLRVGIKGPKAKVAKQLNCCKSYVANISSKGICFNNLPQKMFQEANDKFKVIFRSREREYAMFVQPKWRKNGNNGYMIGAEILTVPAGWENFVNGFCQPVEAEAA